MFSMSPSAEGQDHTSVVPSSFLVPSLANAPGLSVLDHHMHVIEF